MTAMSLHLEIPSMQPNRLADLFAEALGAAPEGVVVHDRDGCIVACNSAAAAILGLTIAQICGRMSTDPRWRTFRADGTPFPPDEHPALVTLRTGEPVTDATMGVHRPDGTLRWIRITTWPLPQAVEGGAVAFFSDVTDARRLEADLLTSQGRLAMAASAGAVGLWEWDLRNGQIWCDDGLARILGLRAAPAAPTVEGLLGRVHPDDRAQTAEQLASVARFQPSSDVSFRIVRTDGVVRHVLAKGQAVEDHDGRPVRLAGALVDVTDSAAAAETVLRHLEAMSDAYFAVDLDWRFTYLNTWASYLLGRERDDLLGRVVWDEFPDAVGTQFERSYREAIESGHPVTFIEHYPPLDRWFDVTATPSSDGLSVFFRDATARRSAEEERTKILTSERQARADAEHAREETAHAATHDDLTGLANRAALRTYLDSALDSDSTEPIAVLFIDVDRFKLINDSAGHAEGDRVLQVIALRLRESASDAPALCRLGGDEFVIATHCSREVAASLAHQVVEGFQEPLQVHGQPHVVTVSVGVAVADEYSTTETLLRDADTALYRAKDRGRNRVCVFDDDLRTLVVRRLGVEQRLRSALDSSVLRAEYQPIFDLASGKVHALETLCRWSDARLGPISPSEFIPIAEETGLVIPLGRAMRDQVRSDAPALLGSAGPGAVVWINVSTLELELPCVADHAIACAESLPGLTLGLEVTESLLCEDPAVVNVLHRLARAGIRLAIDDFGTGYSSLARLGRSPVDLLKIDQSFIADLHDGATQSLVGAIVHMARAVGAGTCAEGVETLEQLHLLRELGVDSVSGYLLARPSPVEELDAATRAGVALLASPASRTTAGRNPRRR